MVCDDKWHSVVRILFFILNEVFSVNTTCFVKAMDNARIVVTPLFQMTFQFPKPFFGRLKYVSMNNWNYTEYIPVVPYYLITMSKSTMTYTTSGQDCLLFPILTVRTMNLTNQRMYFVQLAIHFLIPTVLPAF